MKKKKQAQAEGQLHRGEEYFRALVENSQDAIAIIDANGNLQYGGSSHGRVLGYAQEEQVGKSMLDLVHPDDLQEAAQLFARLVDDPDTVMKTEICVKHKDGSWRVIEVIGKNLLADPIIGGIVANFRDVTERRRAEEALRESEEKYRLLIESARDSVTLHDRDGRYLFINKQGAENLGGKPEDFIGKAFEEVLSREFTETHRKRANKIYKTGRGAVYEDTIRLPGGDTHFLSDLQPVRDASGAIAGIQVIAHNITEYKRIEEELARYRKQLEKLVEERTADLRIKDSAIASSINAMAISDMEGILTYVNPSFIHMWGYKNDDEILGKPAFEFWKEPEKAVEVIEEILNEINWQGELTARRKDGSYFDAYVMASLVRDESGEPVSFVGSFVDITKRKKAEEKMRRLYRKERNLRQQLDGEMKGRVEFTRVLAHELKTPLTPIVMSSETLVNELKEEPYRSLARNIGRGASNLNNRIDELLDLARGEIGMLQLKLEELDVAVLLQEIAEEVEPVASSKSQSLSLDLPSDLPTVRADEDRLRQTVLNLLDNSFKYTPEGGGIIVGARQDNSNLIVEIRDTGPGIARKEQQRLFDPYHKLEGDRERLSGLGLGLALCKVIVELHGGRIWVDSSKGEGATFAFSLPLGGAGNRV